MTTMTIDSLRRLGLSWRPDGSASLRGPLLRLAEDCDRAFREIARVWPAQEERHPATLPTAVLERVAYLRSFPQQATLPVGMDADDANLGAFLAGPVVDGAGAVVLTRLAPVREVLTPAACYHLYAAHQGEALSGPRYLTTVNTCFRRETGYAPLRRLSNFTMREIVCLGDPAEASQFLGTARDAVDRLLRAVDLPVRWQAATDCFFRPHQNPRYLLQRIQPVKHEAVYGGDLAIASTNQHHDHFGTAFDISRGGVPASTACVAFGLERWLFALVDRHGTDPGSWPDLPASAARVAAALRDGRR